MSVNKKALYSIGFIVLLLLWVWRYYTDTTNWETPSQSTQQVSQKAKDSSNSFSIDLTSLEYNEVTDPEIITVNDIWVSIDNRIQVWSTIIDIPLDQPTWTFDTIEELQLSGLEWYTMIYSLPSLDTPVCTKQTKQIEFAGKEFEDSNFVTISHDMPFALERFCGDNNISNVLTLSDGRTKKFAQENWLYMNEFDLMTRAIVIIDDAMEVLYVDYADEVTQDVDLLNAFAFLKTL